MEASVACSSVRVNWYHHVVDFANIFKAFVGIQYMTLSYGIEQSGVILGCIGILTIAVMTTHCCHLIVKCKYYTIDYVCKQLKTNGITLNATGESSASSNISSSLADAPKSTSIYNIRKRMEQHLTYKDIGSILYGQVGTAFVVFCLTVTQAGFCVGYHIFNGNLLLTIIEASSHSEKPTTSAPHNDSFDTLQRDTYYGDKMYESLETTSSFSPTQEPSDSNWNSQLALALLVLLPVPLFILFTLFRQVRGIGPISVIANIIVAVGFVIVFTFILIDFEFAPGIQMAKWSTFPVLLGQAAAAYEAIGTILTIEASMEGNRPRFPSFLFGSVILFTSLFTPLAILGYLRYGDHTSQILLQNLPQNDIVIIMLEFAVMTAVLLTYPIQIFPVIQMMEILLFSYGQPFGPKEYGILSDDPVDTTTPLLKDNPGSEKYDNPLKVLGYNVALTVPNEVPTWKRNTLRVMIAILIALVAVAMRNYFAYASALVGALGSSPMAFILPCLFHIKLKRHEMSWAIFAKDVFIIVLATVSSFVIVVTTIKQML